MFAAKARERHLLAPLVVLAILLGLVVTPFVVAPARAAGTNYYVNSVNGSDSNSGTSSSSPWRTMGPLNSRSFSAGDTINLASGSTWTGGGNNTSVLTINGSGAQGSPITVKPYGTGNAPVLTNPSSVNNPSFGITVKAPWVTIQGLKFQNIREAALMLYGDHGVIQDNEMVQVGAGIEPRSQYNLITRNYIHDGIIVMDDGAGMSWGGNGLMIHASNNEVSYNRFVNNVAPSSQAGSLDGGAVEFFDSVSNTKIHHNYANNVNGFMEIGSQGATDSNTLVADNVIINPGVVVGIHIGGYWATYVNNFQFINNTVISTNSTNGPNYFYMDGGNSTNWQGGNLVVRNNIFYNSGATMGLTQNSNIPFVHDHNIYYGVTYIQVPLDGTEKNTDPRFANFGGGDYRLQSSSPAIGAALSPAPIGTDYDGCSVPVGGSLDIGAYEYGGTAAPPTATAAPTTTATPVVGPVMIDNFDGYASDAALQAAWPVASNTQVTLSRNAGYKYDGSYGMALAYTLGTYNFGGVNRNFGTAANWTGKKGIAFWLKPDGSGRSLRIQFTEVAGEYWEAPYVMSGSTATTVFLPWTSFAHPGWYTGGAEANGAIDPGAIGQLSLYVNQDSTGTGSSTIYVDSIQAADGALTNPTPTATAVPTKTATPGPTVAPSSTPGPTVVPTATPGSTNLLKNGSFDSGNSPWELSVVAPAAGNWNRDSSTHAEGSYSAKVTITAANSGATHTVQFRQPNLTVISGRQYQVTFWAKAAAARSVQVVVQQMNSPYTIFMNQTSSLTTGWQKFTYTFTAGQSASGVFLGYNLAGSTPTVWIDGVSVTQSGPSALVGPNTAFLPIVVNGVG